MFATMLYGCSCVLSDVLGYVLKSGKSAALQCVGECLNDGVILW